MDPFTLFLVNAALFVASALLTPAPKVRDREATPFEEARLPSTDPQRSVQVGWGRYRITAPHLMGVTEYTPVAIEQSVGNFLNSRDVTVGFRYFVGMYMGCGTGTVNLRKIIVGGELLWDVDVDGFTSQSATDGDVIDLNKPDFFGGRESGGGVIGRLRFYRGDAGQRVDPYISSFAEHQPTPAYRFTSYISFENVEIGETPALDQWEFVCDRNPVDYLGLGLNLRIDGQETDSEANPMAIAAELLVDDNFGEGEPLANIDVARLNAMGDTLAAEGLGMSLKWVNEETIERLFKIIQDHIDGFIFKKIGTGVWAGNLNRNDFDISTIREINPSNAELRQFARRNWPETSNQALIDWNDRDLDRRPTPAVEHDYSNFNRIGRVRQERKTFPGVYSEQVATQIASRSLKSISFPFANGEFVGDRSFFDAEPGEPMKLVWPAYGITQLVVRAGAIGYGTSQTGDMPISFVEDFFSQALADFTGLQSAPGAQVGGPPQAITIFLGIELPFFLQTVDETIDPPVGAAGTEVNKIGFLARKPQSNSLEFRMYEESIDGQPITAQELSDFTPVGELVGVLEESTADEGVVIQIDNVADSVAMIERGAAPEAVIKSTGQGLALIEDGTSEEWVGVTAIGNNGDGTYNLTIARGLMDTLPKTWAADARVWFVGAALGVTRNTHGTNASIGYRVENLTSLGAELSAIQTRNFQNHSSKPYPAGNFEITDVTPSTQKYPTAPLAEGDITFEWEGRDRTLPDLLFQNDNGVIEAGFEYLLTIYDNTNPGAPVQLRQRGRTATGTGADTTPLSAESFIWTAADQAVDDPGGSIAQIRVDLRVQGNGSAFSTSIINREDVRRSFQRTIVIPPPLTGGYQSYVESLSGLQHYWPLNEPVGPSVFSASVGGVNGTLIGDVSLGSYPIVSDDRTFSASKVGRTESDRLEIAASASLALSTAWTINFWVVITPSGEGTGVQPIYVKARSAALPAVQVNIDAAGECRVTVRSGGAATDVSPTLPAVIGDGQPHMVTLTQDTSGGNAVVLAFVDGMAYGTTTLAVGLPDNNVEPIELLGSTDAVFSGGGGTRGMISHVQHYTRALSRADVIENYLAGLRDQPMRSAILRSNPSSWWPLQEWQGSFLIHDFIGNVADFNQGTAAEAPTSRAAGPAPLPEKSFAMSFDGVNDNLVIGQDTFNGDTYGAIGCWFKRGSMGGSGLEQIFTGGNTGGARVGGIVITNGFIQGRMTFEGGGAAWRLTSDALVDDDQWHRFDLVNPQGTAKPFAVLDGKVISDGNGATLVTEFGFDGSEWWADIDDFPMFYVFGANAVNLNNFEGEIADAMIWRETTPDVEALRQIYYGTVGTLRGVTDLLLDEDPHHVFELDSFSNIVDIMNNMNGVPGVWQNTSGNEQQIGQMPIAADDTLESIYLPRNGALANAVHATFTNRAFLEGPKGLLNFTDYGWIVQFAPETDDQAMVFGNDDASASSLNLFVEMATDTFAAEIGGLDFQKFLPGNLGIATDAATINKARAATAAGFERTIGGGSPPSDMAVGERRIIIDLGEADYAVLNDQTTGDNDPNLVEIYSGGQMDNAFIAAWQDGPQDNTRNLGGLLGRLAMYDRVPQRSRLFLNTLRGQGYHEHALYTMAYEPVLYLRFDEAAGATTYLDASGNANNGSQSQIGTGGSIETDEANNRSNIWNENLGVARFAPVDLFNGLIVETDNVPFQPSAFPYTVAFWGRIGVADSDAGDQLGFAWGDSGAFSRYSFRIRHDTHDLQFIVQNVGVQDVENVDLPDDLILRSWNHWAFQFVSASDIRVLCNGVQVASMGLLSAPTFTANNFTIMGEINSNTDVAFVGELHDFAVFDQTVGEAQIREIYAHSFAPNYDAKALELAPVAYWKLNEREIDDRYRNSVLDGSGQLVMADGDSNIVQRSPSVVPNYPDSSVESTGTGAGIDTNFNGYPTGSANFSAVFWMFKALDSAYTSTSRLMAWGDAATVADGRIFISVRSDGRIRVDTEASGAYVEWDAPEDQILHIAVALDGTTLNDLSLFINGADQGAPVASNTPTNTINITQTDNLHLLAGSDGTFPADAGRMGRVALYDRALTATEISELFDAGAGESFDAAARDIDPPHWWRLHEANMTPVGSVIDQTGGNDGQGVNPPTEQQAGPLVNEATFMADFDGVNDFIRISQAIPQQSAGAIAGIITAGTGLADNYIGIFAAGMAGTTNQNSCAIGFTKDGATDADVKFTSIVRDGGRTNNPQSIIRTVNKFDAGVPHHVLVRADGTNDREIWVDGIKQDIERDDLDTAVSEGQAPGDLIWWSSECEVGTTRGCIGARDKGDGTDGYVDIEVSEVMIWDDGTFPSEEDIRRLARAAKRNSPPV